MQKHKIRDNDFFNPVWTICLRSVSYTHLEEEKTIWPHHFGFDGFYMARLKKINSKE